MDAPLCPTCHKRHWARVCSDFSSGNVKGIPQHADGPKTADGIARSKSRGSGKRKPTETHQLPRPASARAAPCEESTRRSHEPVSARTLNAEGALQSVGATNPKRGRPRIEDKAKTLEATEPWKNEGMSRATWYARRREEK